MILPKGDSGITRPKIRDVARMAGVSVGSVSRVLNANRTVTEEIRAKVESVIAELQYRPNPTAQSMRGHLTRTVGCLVRNINIPGFARCVAAAQDVFAEAGFALLLANSDGNPERERELIALMAARRTDALLAAHCSERSKILDESIAGAGMPVVLIDRERPASADAVVVDHRSGIRQVAEALIALGHRRIALLTGSTALYPSRERIAAYKAALTAAAIPFVPHLLRTGSFQADFGMTQTLLLLDERPAPTAIIAGGIVMLPGVVRALRQRRVAIPRDMSLIAAGDSDVADLLQPAIAVVRWDYAEMGRLAAGLALERIRGGRPSEPRRIVVPSDIVPRDSLAAPR